MTAVAPNTFRLPLYWKRPNITDYSINNTNKVNNVFGDKIDVRGNDNIVIVNKGNDNNNRNFCCPGGENQQNGMTANMIQMLTKMFGGIMQLFGQMIGSLGNFNQLGNCGSYASLLNGGLEGGLLF